LLEPREIGTGGGNVMGTNKKVWEVISNSFAMKTNCMPHSTSL
jgi:hypothetical protein